MPQRLPLHFFSIYTPVSDYSFKSRSVCRGLLNLHLQFGSQIHTSTFISDTFTHMSNGHLTFDMSKMKFPHFKLVPSQPDHASPYSLRPLQSKPQLMCFWIIVFFLPFPHPAKWVILLKQVTPPSKTLRWCPFQWDFIAPILAQASGAHRTLWPASVYSPVHPTPTTLASWVFHEHQTPSCLGVFVPVLVPPWDFPSGIHVVHSLMPLFRPLLQC